VNVAWLWWIIMKKLQENIGVNIVIALFGTFQGFHQATSNMEQD
jgi:hypothetical protein